MKHSRRYLEYVKSDPWFARRENALKRAKRKCEACQSKEHLQVHHFTYERLGHEDPGDLVVLCEACHKVADADRKKNTKILQKLKKKGKDKSSYQKKAPQKKIRISLRTCANCNKEHTPVVNKKNKAMFILSCPFCAHESARTIAPQGVKVA